MVRTTCAVENEGRVMHVFKLNLNPMLLQIMMDNSLLDLERIALQENQNFFINDSSGW